VATLELLAKISDQAAKLSQGKINCLCIIVLDQLDNVGKSYRLLLCLWGDCDGCHLGLDSVMLLQDEKMMSTVEKHRQCLLSYRHFEKASFARDLSHNEDDVRCGHGVPDYPNRVGESAVGICAFAI
jgi:hypothetical protein